MAVAKAIRYGEPSVSVREGDGRAMVAEGGIDMLSAASLDTESTIYYVSGARNWARGAQADLSRISASSNNRN